MGEDLESVIESILFTMGDQVPLDKISFAIGKNEDITKNLIKKLSDTYEKQNRGIKIIEINESYQMCSNPIYFGYIKKICNIKNKIKLTDSVLETLSIVAYKQPITKIEIEEIRGINSSHAINKLIDYNLISEKGRKKSPGRPILFVTTDEFLKCCGFKNINDLPKIKDNIDVLRNETFKKIEKLI